MIRGGRCENFRQSSVIHILSQRSLRTRRVETSHPKHRPPEADRDKSGSTAPGERRGYTFGLVFLLLKKRMLLFRDLIYFWHLHYFQRFAKKNLSQNLSKTKYTHINARNTFMPVVACRVQIMWRLALRGGTA